MFEREEYNLELKEKVSKTFLKTVSAFSNYNDGQIVFGVDDNGDAVGLLNVEEDSLKIENMINDTINPMPEYRLERERLDSKEIIILNVFKGKQTPYYYRSRAYRRADTATLEVDRLELNRLVMEGVYLDYEEQRSSNQDLEFKILELKLKNRVGISELNLDILKTLNLYNKDEYYTIAGELLADENEIEFSGIDIVRFGKDINQILSRENLNNRSLLLQYDQSIEIFERYYQYEEIKGYNRVKQELIPQEAFREALANAIVHRDWSIRAAIQISMYENRIEINSPGGLPKGISEEDYLRGTVSILRNPIIAGVFYRLNLIEKFGTGIKRIIHEYRDSLSKADFQITDNNIKIILPIIKNELSNLSKDESTIYELLKDGMERSRLELDQKSGFNKSKTLRNLNSLIDKNLIKKLGKGPETSYALK